MTVNLIAAVGRRGQLGLDGKLPWKDAKDLAWFRKMTMGGFVVVGPKTYHGLPPLPGRYLFLDDKHREPLDIIAQLRGISHNREIWIAGGAKTYARWIPFVEHLHISKIDYDGPADVWMPPIWGSL